MHVTIVSHEIPGTDLIVSIHRNTIRNHHLVELSRNGYTVKAAKVGSNPEARALANEWWQDNHPDRPTEAAPELGQPAYAEPTADDLGGPGEMEWAAGIENEPPVRLDYHDTTSPFPAGPPRSAYSPGPRVTEPGLYLMGSRVYQVVKSQTSGNLYAKRLETGGGWAYAPGAMTKLRPEDKMTLEQAQEYGRTTGICARCGAELTNPKSVELGIGPICRGYF